MTRRLFAACVTFAALFACRETAFAQATPGEGHWSGAIELPTGPLQVEVDLKPGAPAWTGTITIPAQNLKGYPLEAIQVQGKEASFAIPRVPGSPMFKGQLSADGKEMLGEFTQGEGRLPFKLTRTGEASFPAAAKSTAITKDIEGTWAGTLDAGGQTLRLTLKLASGPDGATGTIVSVDQGGAEIPIQTITQTASKLELNLPMIAGTYTGELKDGKLVGEWAQGPGKMPLTFTRVP